MDKPKVRTVNKADKNFKKAVVHVMDTDNGNNNVVSALGKYLPRNSVIRNFRITAGDGKNYHTKRYSEGAIATILGNGAFVPSNVDFLA